MKISSFSKSPKLLFKDILEAVRNQKKVVVFLFLWSRKVM